MLRKFLIGPALLGAGYAGGSYYGADSEQLVRKSPDEVRDAVEQAASDRAGTMELEGGKPVPYETKVERTDDGGLILRIMMAGKQAAETDVALVPQDGGKGHADDRQDSQRPCGAPRRACRNVEGAAGLRARLDAQPHRAPAAAPDRRADRAGQAVGDPMHGFQSQADWEASLPPDKQREMQEWHQYDASRPMTDPDADAKKFMNGGK